MQVLMFLLMTFTFMSATMALLYSLLPGMTGYSLATILNLTEKSPVRQVNMALWVQAAFNICSFLLPAYVYAYLSTPEPMKYLGLRAPKAVQVVLAVLVMLGAMPVLSSIAELIGHIDFQVT